MELKTILQTVEKFVTDNSPGILTGLGVAGTVTTAVLAGKATIHADRLLELNVAHLRNPNGSLDNEHKLSNKQIIELVWKEYIPPATVLSATVAAIIMANQIGSRRTAAITAAFKLSEQISGEYKERVIKTLGLQKEEKMRSELAGEKMIANPPPSGMIIVTGSDVLMLDEMSGRYFTGQLENVRKAVNDINYKVNNYFFASLTDFYELIGLTGTKFSEEVGWNTDALLDVTFTPTMYEEKPAIMLSYSTAPTRSYDRCQ